MYVSEHSRMWSNDTTEHSANMNADVCFSNYVFQQQLSYIVPWHFRQDVEGVAVEIYPRWPCCQTEGASSGLD